MNVTLGLRNVRIIFHLHESHHSNIFLISVCNFYNATDLAWVCFTQVSPDMVKEVAAFSKECLEKIEKSRVEGDFNQVRRYAPVLSSVAVSPAAQQTSPLSSQVLKLCRECLQKQEKVLADTHLYRLRVLSVASEVLSYLHQFSEAADFTHRMIGGYMWVLTGALVIYSGCIQTERWASVPLLRLHVVI